MLLFCAPRKYKKTDPKIKGLLMFSGGMGMQHEKEIC